VGETEEVTKDVVEDVTGQEIQAETQQVLQEATEDVIQELTEVVIQDEGPEVAAEEPAPELDLRVSLPEAIELGFTPAPGSPFQGDIRL
jgi:hypothetical protein